MTRLEKMATQAWEDRVDDYCEDRACCRFQHGFESGFNACLGMFEQMPAAIELCKAVRQVSKEAYSEAENNAAV